jgi:oligoribonuclease (3'-5' exoribonuclease)
MSNSEYSQLITKMEELKELSATYNSYVNTYTPAVSSVTAGNATATFTQESNKNAISNTVIPRDYRPGEDYGEHWKYVGKVTPGPGLSNTLNDNSLKCWNMAARDLRVFKKVVYTGDPTLSSNPGQVSWNNHCYGLMYDAPNSAETILTDSNGYSTMQGRAGFGTNKYTKLGITNADTLNKATQLKSIQERVNSLVQDIAEASNAGINTDLNEIVGSAADSNALMENINKYMKDGSAAISGNYEKGDKRKVISDVYMEVNEKRALYSRKYRFIFYSILAICIIAGYASYTSKLSLTEQLEILKQYLFYRHLDGI